MCSLIAGGFASPVGRRFKFRRRRLTRAHRPALLAHELRDVVGAERVLAGGAGAFPAAEGWHAGLRAGRRPAAPVAVGDARLHRVEELFPLFLDLRENPGGQPVVAAVGQRDGLVERGDRPDSEQRREILLMKERGGFWQLVDDGRLDKMTVLERAFLQHPSVARAQAHGLLETRHGGRVD